MEDLQGLGQRYPGPDPTLELVLGFGLGSDGEAEASANSFCKSRAPALKGGESCGPEESAARCCRGPRPQLSPDPVALVVRRGSHKLVL